MASGRLPGDFWPRIPGFRPPGAESSAEDDGDMDGADLDDDEAEAAEALMDDMMDYVTNHPSSDDEMAMKRPSAKAMKRPAAKAGLPAGASTVPKAKAKGKAKADKTTKPKAKAKPKATASAKGKGKSKSNGNTKGKGKSKGKRSGKGNSKGKGKNKGQSDDETAEVETTKDEEPVTVRSLGSDGLPVDETVGGSQMSRPADQQPQKFGCSKCRYKGCSKCRQ